jgi:hypothetical protein
MRLIITLFIISAFAVSCGGLGNKYSADSDFYYNQVTEQNVIDTYIFDEKMKRELMFTPPLLRPTYTDYLTINADLNGDGKKDILAAVNHRKFMEDGKYRIYVFIANDYGFTQLKPYFLSDTLNIKVLGTSSQGMAELSAGERVFKYDGTTYK